MLGVTLLRIELADLLSTFVENFLHGWELRCVVAEGIEQG